MPYDPLVSHGVSPSQPLAESYWHATHKPETLPPLSKNISSDYLVIGGGYTGLSAAMTLAEAGQQVALLDANSLGFGCAGRNGGFILSGSGRLSLSAIENRWGYAVAKGMQAEFDGAVNLLNQRIADFDMRVDLVKGPYLKLAHSSKQANLLCDSAKHHESQFNVASTLLSQEDLTSRFGIKGAFGGVEVNGACLHPLKLVSEYARVAKALGASLYYDSPATRIEKHKTGYVVTTPNGSVSAKHILIATNAYTPKRFHDAVDNKQFPVQSSILVTAPMNEDSIAMDYFWSGWVSVSLDSMPRIFVDNDASNNNTHRSGSTIGYAMGYCGSGVSFAAFAGQRLAQRMLGTCDVDLSLPLYCSPLKTYPFAKARRLALHGLYQWAKFAER